MAGVVLENLSNRKLSILGVTLLLILLAFFLLGGIIAPAPNNVMNTLTVPCYDRSKVANKTKWFIPRGKDTCDQVDDLKDPRIYKEGIDANQIVFAQWLPLPRDGGQLDMSRWFQNMVAVIQMDIVYDERTPMVSNPMLTLEVRLGYRYKYEKENDWKELASAKEERPLDCTLKEKKDGEYYDCDLLPFFELGSVHYDYYLINIRLPVGKSGVNMGIGKVEDLHVITIFQNGGFTKVWFSMKTVVFPLLLGVLIWYWRRIQQLSRLPNLLERVLFCLGLVLTCLNTPIEWLTLVVNIPAMELINDIRQVMLYIMLMCFWKMFVDNSNLDRPGENSLRVHWKALGIFITGGVGFLVFKVTERAVPLMNPFSSIWNTPESRKLGLGFTVFFCVIACLYFLFLCYVVVMAIRKLYNSRNSNCYQLGERYEVCKLAFWMLVTLLCAALTVIFFIISQVSEESWKWGDENSQINLEYTSAFLTGIYGMWNVYVAGVMFTLQNKQDSVTAVQAKAEMYVTGQCSNQDSTQDKTPIVET